MFFGLVITKLFAQFSEQKLLEMQNKIDLQETQIKNMNENMRSHASLYRTGTIMIILGAVTEIAGAALLAGGQNNSVVPVIIGIGGALCTVGIVVQWNSNKFFKYGNQTKTEYLRQFNSTEDSN